MTKKWYGFIGALVVLLAVSFGLHTDTTNVQAAVGTTTAPTQLYNGFGNKAQPADRVLWTGSAWQLNWGIISRNGEKWFNVGGNQYVNANTLTVGDTSDIKIYDNHDETKKDGTTTTGTVLWASAGFWDLFDNAPTPDKTNVGDTTTLDQKYISYNGTVFYRSTKGGYSLSRDIDVPNPGVLPVVDERTDDSPMVIELLDSQVNYWFNPADIPNTQKLGGSVPGYGSKWLAYSYIHVTGVTYAEVGQNQWMMVDVYLAKKYRNSGENFSAAFRALPSKNIDVPEYTDFFWPEYRQFLDGDWRF
ncbi:MAG: hypothetical protein LKF36_08020 [Lactobacillus sp.]|nr:hypothetical protein [Lactobacillus sp.]